MISMSSTSTAARCESVMRLKGGFVFGEPKTKRSRRQILLPKEVAEALRQHRVRQAEERLRMGSAWQDIDLAFPNEVGNVIEAGNLLRRSFWPVLQRAGLPRSH